MEAKLYSSMGQAGDKLHNQIERKLTIGLRAAQEMKKDFYFIVLDVAPADCLARLNSGASLEEAKKKASGFGCKWLTSYWFSHYKCGHELSPTPLETLLSQDGLNAAQANQLAERMRWLTWADVFKVVLRAVIPVQA